MAEKKKHNFCDCENPVLECKDKSLTQQQFRDECDINNIMKKAEKTGLFPVCKAQPVYGDFSKRMSTLEAMNFAATIKRQFAALPVEIRSRFDHNVANLVEFLADEKNLEESYKLGLRIEPEESKKAKADKAAADAKAKAGAQA